MTRSRRADDSDGPEPRWAADALFDGAVSLLQPRAGKGYRVNVDTLLLAAFAAECRPEARTVVDLGAGVGALSLAFAHFGAARRSVLVEQDPSLAELSERNLASAGLLGHAVVAELVRQGLPAALRGTADVVLSNPPFFTGDESRTAPARRAARVGPLAPFLLAAADALGARSRAFFVYPAPTLPEFFAAATAARLVAKRLRMVHAFAASKARLALVELRRGKPGGLVVDAPSVEWTAPGARTPELEAIVRGDLGAALTARRGAGRAGLPRQP